MTIQQAQQSAELIQKQIENNGIELGYEELQKAIKKFEDEGYPLESIIPESADSGLGFSLKRADGKTFWEIYSKAIRKSLCDEKGEFNKLFKNNITASVTAIVAALVSGLGLPLFALGIVAPIAAIIATTGVDAFCEFNKEEKNE
jgi:hypothetical protein